MSETFTVTWEDPPGIAKNGARQPDVVLAAFAEELRTHPEQWARYPRDLKNYDSAQVTARNIKRANTETWEPRGAFEATVRTVDGKARLYVRYIGGTS